MNKKEKIREYKQTVRPMGVYQIKNNKSDRVFIGSSKDIHGRINRIKFQLKNGLYPDQEIQKDYSETGESGFSFDVLDYLSPKEDLNYNYDEELKILEEMWLHKIQPYGEKGYNKKETTE